MGAEVAALQERPVMPQEVSTVLGGDNSKRLHDYGEKVWDMGGVRETRAWGSSVRTQLHGLPVVLLLS